ncbi:hypothetical protein [Neisseria sp.]|uniref:hypothetical protein n=1 Tax=Neisseria sp. TaxID=192066 RepID=UPI0034C6826A
MGRNLCKIRSGRLKYRRCVECRQTLDICGCCAAVSPFCNPFRPIISAITIHYIQTA